MELINRFSMLKKTKMLLTAKVDFGLSQVESMMKQYVSFIATSRTLRSKCQEELRKVPLASLTYMLVSMKKIVPLEREQYHY